MKRVTIFFIILFVVLGGIVIALTMKTSKSKKTPSVHSSSSSIPTSAVSAHSPAIPTVAISPAQQDHTHDLQDAYAKANQPDLFLSNRTPFTASDFSVTSDFTQSPTEHFFFTVTLKTPAVKQSFESWVQSLGLTTTQIQNLDIRYQ